MSLHQKAPRGGNASSDFITTHWTTVIQAAKTGSPDTLRALEKLCAAYWYPIFVFIRRKGHSEHDAQDLTQMFFAHLLSKESLKKADQTKGRFRTFLLASATNFLSNERDRKQTQKRGGLVSVISFEECSPEELYRREPADRFAPERLFERRWAFVLIDRVMARLRSEYENSGKSPVFSELHRFLTVEAGASALGKAAERLGMEVGAVKVAVHRLRRRFGGLLRQEISLTVASPEEVDAEIRNLMSLIAE